MLDTGSYYIKNLINQIGIDYKQKLSERISFSSILLGNLDDNEVSKFSFGIESLNKSNWKTIYLIDYSKDKRNQDRVSFNFGIELEKF